MNVCAQSVQYGIMILQRNQPLPTAPLSGERVAHAGHIIPATRGSRRKPNALVQPNLGRGIVFSVVSFDDIPACC